MQISNMRQRENSKNVKGEQHLKKVLLLQQQKNIQQPDEKYLAPGWQSVCYMVNSINGRVYFLIK